VVEILAVEIVEATRSPGEPMNGLRTLSAKNAVPLASN
jgi:hypothetical protein